MHIGVRWSDHPSLGGDGCLQSTVFLHLSPQGTAASKRCRRGKDKWALCEKKTAAEAPWNERKRAKGFICLPCRRASNPNSKEPSKVALQKNILRVGLLTPSDSKYWMPWIYISAWKARLKNIPKRMPVKTAWEWLGHYLLFMQRKESGDFVHQRLPTTLEMMTFVRLLILVVSKENFWVQKTWHERKGSANVMGKSIFVSAPNFPNYGIWDRLPVDLFMHCLSYHPHISNAPDTGKCKSNSGKFWEASEMNKTWH